MQFYQIRANAQTNKYPRILRVVTELPQKICHPNAGILLDRNISVYLDDVGSTWPDCIGFYYEGYTAFSENVLSILKKEKIDYIKYFKVNILHHDVYYPKKLIDVQPPQYWVIDNRSITGVEVDYAKSFEYPAGKCKKCHCTIFDVDKQMEAIVWRTNAKENYPVIFRPDTWNGKDIFTDPSKNVIYCTQYFLDSAKNYNINNLVFIPIEKGFNANNRQGKRY